MTEDLKGVIQEIRGHSINLSNLNLPTQRSLLALSHLLANVVKANTDEVIFKDQLIEKAKEKRYEQEQIGKVDNFANSQLATTLDL